ncbi:MAG: HPr kinase/phosphorylase [Acidiphilium sp.]
MHLHGSCAALGDDGVLLLGPPGSGKSDLLLRLLDRGFELVGDDQLILDDNTIRPLPSLSGIIEIRGLGLFRQSAQPAAQLRLVARLSGVPGTRLPIPYNDPVFGKPEITLDAFTASAPIRVQWALEAACGRRAQHCGAFVR